MDGRTFIGGSYRGAMTAGSLYREGAAALRNFVDRRAKSPNFDWYQQTYANTVLRGFLRRHRLFDMQRSYQLDQASRRWTAGRELRKQTSLDQVARRWVTLDQDALDQIDQFLDRNLPDKELPNLSKKIGDIISQLSVSSPQRNALIALFNYINAQGSIALGYTEDILTPRNQSGDVVAAIGWALWSTPSAGFSTWGADFGKRIQYVSSRGGDITFILPEGDNGHTFTAQGAFTAYRIWKETLEQIDAMPNPSYKFMLSRIIEDDILSKINDPKDLRILYAYHVFRLVYGASNKSSSPIANTPIAKATIDLRTRRAIRALADGNGCDFDQYGATTYFELAFLLHTKTKFKIVGSEEKIRSFVDFSMDRRDPIEREFRDRFKALMAPETLMVPFA